MYVRKIITAQGGRVGEGDDAIKKARKGSGPDSDEFYFRPFDGSQNYRLVNVVFTQKKKIKKKSNFVPKRDKQLC